VLPFSIVLAWDAFGSLNASYGYCDCVDAVESITLIVSNERRCDLNLGVIPTDEIAKYRLRLLNKTDVELEIQSVVATCGCVATTIAAGYARLGESIEVELTVHPRSPGGFYQTLLMKAKQPGDKDVHVTVRCEAKQRIAIQEIDRSRISVANEFSSKISLGFPTILDGF